MSRFFLHKKRADSGISSCGLTVKYYTLTFLLGISMRYFTPLYTPSTVCLATFFDLSLGSYSAPLQLIFLIIFLWYVFFNSRVPSGTLCLLLPSPLKRSLKEMNDSYIFNQNLLIYLNSL